MLDKDTLLEILSYLDCRLGENLLSMDLSIYGGALMNLVYDCRPATKDIDAVFSSSNDLLLESIFDDIASIFSLDRNWINQDIKVPLQFLKKQDVGLSMKFNNIRLFTPSAEQMLAMKILAARPEPANDFIDSYILCKELNLKTKRDIMRVVLEFVPSSLLGERQNMFLHYLLIDIGGTND